MNRAIQAEMVACRAGEGGRATGEVDGVLLERGRALFLWIIKRPVEVLDIALREMIDNQRAVNTELQDEFCIYTSHDYLEKGEREQLGSLQQLMWEISLAKFRFDNDIQKSRCLQNSATKNSREPRKSRAQRNGKHQKVEGRARRGRRHPRS